MIQSKKLLMNDNVTLTVVTTPASATCTLTYNSVQYSTKTLTVPKGSTISYSVYYSTYGTTSGSITMDKDKTLTCTGTSGTSSTDVFTQSPSNLSSNGTMGGDSFAVSQDSSINDQDRFRAWKCFDGVTGANYWCSDNTNYPHWISWYFPNATRITAIMITNRNTYNIGDYTIQGSSNNSNWSNITSGTSSNTAGGGSWSISISSNDYYKYWRIYATSGIGSTKYCGASEIYVQGYYQSTTTTYYWDTSTT